MGPEPSEELIELKVRAAAELCKELGLDKPMICSQEMRNRIYHGIEIELSTEHDLGIRIMFAVSDENPDGDDFLFSDAVWENPEFLKMGQHFMVMYSKKVCEFVKKYGSPEIQLREEIDFLLVKTSTQEVLETTTLAQSEVIGLENIEPLGDAFDKVDKHDLKPPHKRF